MASDTMQKFEQDLLDRLAERPQATPDTRGAGNIIYVGDHANCDVPDLDSALASAQDNDELRLQNQTFEGRFQIHGKSISVIGGFEDCTGAEPRFSSTLQGEFTTTLEITHPESQSTVSDVRLENLNITNGIGTSDLLGGGVHIEGGLLDVVLIDVVIRDNETAARGGGLMATGNTGPMVTIRGDSVIQNNIAVEGGGLACVGPQDTPGVNQPLLVIDTGLVWLNEARRGGGVYSNNCTVISHAGGLLQGIVNNEASSGSGADTGQGGGIFAEQHSGIGLFGAPGFFGEGDPDSPALLADNNAASIGGGALIRGDSSMTASDAVIESNSAGNNGGGIHVTESSFTMERVNGTTCREDRCSRLRGNSAQTGGGISIVNPNDGTTRGASGTASSVVITQTFVSGNRAIGSGSNDDDGAGAAVFILDGSAYLEGNVMFENSGDNLIRQQPNTSLTLAWSTAADNASNGGALLLARGAASGDTRTRLLSSIVQNPDGDIMALDASSGTGFDFVADCLVANELTSMPGVSGSIAESDPGFLDPAADDYHLRHDAPAVDLCSDSNVSVEPDMDDQDRGFAVTDPAAPFDAGADESQGVIFANGFET
ncbi:MAG: hypothetical protein R6V61_08205 [Wenzhouxiangellaceae bacterium]